MSVIGIGASEDGTLVIAYQDNHLGLYESKVAQIQLIQADLTGGALAESELAESE